MTNRYLDSYDIISMILRKIFENDYQHITNVWTHWEYTKWTTALRGTKIWRIIKEEEEEEHQQQEEMKKKKKRTAWIAQEEERKTQMA